MLAVPAMPSIGIWLLGLLLMACLLGLSGAPQAQVREKGAIPTHVDYEIEGKRFRVPEPYLGGFTSHWKDARSGRFTRTSYLDVAFWVSDGKPSPVRGISLTTFWPKEAGRPSSGDGDFVVSAFHIEYLPPGKELTEVLPSRRFRNGVEGLMPEPYRSSPELVHGLTCYTNLHPNVHGVSCALDNQDLDIVLNADWDRRDWPGGRPPNPLWQMHLYSKTDGLWIWLRFPEVALKRWADVVCQTLTLVRSWEFPPSQSQAGCFHPRIANNPAPILEREGLARERGWYAKNSCRISR